MPEKDFSSLPPFPWSGCGANKERVGSRFSLYPLDNNYSQIILESLARIEASKIFSQTDALSTLFRGNLTHIFDCLSAFFIGAYRDERHLCLEGLVSCGCPGDCDSDSPPPTDDKRLNRFKLTKRDFPLKAKLSLYPLGIVDYLPIIAKVIRLAEQMGLNPRVIHYVTRIDGAALKIFDYLEAAAMIVQKEVSHFVLHFTLSAGSHTLE
ncbi:MAG: Ykof family thiamine-binding protein [Deltaproteobacteria bacterium]|jgi:uncharacterized protein YqgV (UPF0045/DUF77 family)|nr:Ykof family thiamine-binding protein [Deltaproteobacteria bacterium]